MNAVQSLGIRGDGRMSALSSYENRVYLLGLESGEVVVVKFYRPNRWSAEQILEEHSFALDLITAEVPVVAPQIINNTTLHSTLTLGATSAVDYLFSVSAHKGGRMPELDDPEVLAWIGRFLARLHLVGGERDYDQREVLSVELLGEKSMQTLLTLGCIPAAYRDHWLSICEKALEQIRLTWRTTQKPIRLHGDCHAGNILWTPVERLGGGPHFVDLDDSRMGPSVQDLWMLQSGSRQERSMQLSLLLEGYTAIREFDMRELALIEPLRTLRIIHYSAWLAMRADDPSFVINFPWFWKEDYWRSQIVTLQEQIEAMQEPALLN